MCWVIVLAAAIVAVLQGAFSGNTDVAEQGMRAVANLACDDINKMLLGTAGACDGE